MPFISQHLMQQLAENSLLDFITEERLEIFHF